MLLRPARGGRRRGRNDQRSFSCAGRSELFPASRSIEPPTAVPSGSRGLPGPVSHRKRKLGKRTTIMGRRGVRPPGALWSRGGPAGPSAGSGEASERGAGLRRRVERPRPVVRDCEPGASRAACAAAGKWPTLLSDVERVDLNAHGAGGRGHSSRVLTAAGRGGAERTDAGPGFSCLGPRPPVPRR